MSRDNHHPPVTSPAPINTAAPSVVAPVVLPSVAAGFITVPSPAQHYTKEQIAEFEEKLSLLQGFSDNLPERPDYGTLGNQIQVLANHFQLQIDHAICENLHCYHVLIKPKASEKESRDVISEVLKKLGQLEIPAYSVRNTLFTVGPLPFDVHECNVNLDYKDQGSFSGSDRKQFVVEVDELTSNPKNQIHAFNAVLRQGPAKKYTVVGKSFFSRSFGFTELTSGVECWKGFFQSVRRTQMGFSLNIAVSSMPFYEAIPVTKFVSQNLKLDIGIELSDQDRSMITNALKGIKLLLNGERRFVATGVSKKPLKDLEFELSADKTKINALDYFDKYCNIIIQKPNLPALQAGSKAKPMYFPMELCEIVPGQRYSKSLTHQQVTEILRASCLRPDERKEETIKIVKQQSFNSDKVVATFGIKVPEDLHLVEARVLPAPKLKYYGSGRKLKLESPQMGQWNMSSKKMYTGGKVEFWSCICFSKTMAPNQLDSFCRELVKMCKEKGLDFNPEPMASHFSTGSNGPSSIEEELKHFSQFCNGPDENQKLQLMIIILPDQKDRDFRSYDYEIIKRVCETKLGIISQCVRPWHAQNIKMQYLENLTLKINVKVGGCNTALNDPVLCSIPLVKDIGERFIIFGSDVTHPSPGDVSSPSIAAVVASMGWPNVTKYRGVVSAQPQRQEIIQDLYKSEIHTEKEVPKPSGMIRELLLSFYKSTGQCKPDRIIFYRDGVGEDQFTQVLLEEVVAIRKACVSLELNYLPPITFVVVQKRIKTRLFPVKKEDTDQPENIMPGTVVDKDICHFKEFDFYLNSHAGIQGRTNRPTHYHVLYDENNFSADQLQSLTYNLCYTYARCTQSLSIVPPAHYAHLLASRARCYLGDAAGTPNVLAELPPIIESVKDNMFYV